MHISEGVLSGQVCVAGYAATIVVAAVTLRKVKESDIPKISVVTAAVFITSLLHVRIGPGNVHLLLNGLAGILLGIAAFPAIMVSLLFQAVMFGHGGLSVYGINCLIMGLPAFLAAFIFRFRKWSNHRCYLLGLAFITGLLYACATVVLGALALVFAGSEFKVIAQVLLWSHVPIIFAEAIICQLTVGFLLKVKPKLLDR